MSQADGFGQTAPGERSTGGLAAVAGPGRLRNATPPVPSEAVDSVKADIGEVKEKVRR
jgi:hypothetical protein